MFRRLVGEQARISSVSLTSVNDCQRLLDRLCCGMTNPELEQEVVMPLLADPVSVSPEQRDMLERLVRTRSTPQQLALRARMLLHVADGMGVRATAREVGVWPKTVRYWCNQWRQAAERQPVADAPRSGAPATFTAEQICAVVALTCERPEDSERPISQWSQREIADEVIDEASLRVSRSARWGVF
jgi:transposase